MDDVTLHAADSELCFDSFPRAQVLRRLGSGGEIGLIRIDKPGIPARLLVDLLYGCGLRVSEPLELRVKDILWQERQLVVCAGQGAKDRRIPIPNSLIDPIRAQMETARKTWEEDRQFAPKVGVPLPHQLAKNIRPLRSRGLGFGSFPPSVIASKSVREAARRLASMDSSRPKSSVPAEFRFGSRSGIPASLIITSKSILSSLPIST